MRASIAVAMATGVALALAAGSFAERVVLANGDVLDAERVEPGEDGWIIEHPVLGTLALAEDAVASVGVEPDVEVAEHAPAAPETGTAVPDRVDEAAGSFAGAGTPDDGIFGTGWFAGFERAFSLGASGARGNSENLDVTTGLDFDFEDDHTRWIFDGRLYYSESGREKTKSQAYIDLTRDWLLPDERHFYFGQLRWDIDEFEDWDHRGSLGGGVGWNLVDREDFALRARTGLAVTRQFGGPEEETDFELLLRIETDWSPTEHQTFTAYNTVYPSLKDSGEFRNLTGVTWKVALAEPDGVGLQLGVENEYESDVVRGTRRNDLQYNASLVVDF